MKKIVKSIPLLLMLGIILALSSCFWSRVNDDNIELEEKQVEFENISSEYNVKSSKVNLYFYKDGNVPLINIETFYSMLNGYYDISKKEVSINPNFNRLYIVDKSQSLIRTIFDWRYNTITLKNELSPYGICSGGTRDYTSYYDLKLVKPIMSIEIEYYLGDYNIDILYNNGNVLIPLNVLNFIGSGYYNAIYNGNKIYGFYYGDDLSDVYDNKLVGVPDDIIDESNNELFFLLNEKYGLKDYNNVSDYKSYISKEVVENLNSKDAEVRNDALVTIVNKILDDPHSRMINSSMYSSNKDDLSTIKYLDSESRTVKVGTVINKLRNQNKESEKGNNPIYYKEDTLFLTLSDFSLGIKEEVYETDGVYKEDAYLKDTPALFYKALNDAKNNHSEVKNVVIDVSFNGGGYVAAMFRALTFLSERNIYFGYSINKDYTEIYNILGDTDMDGNYDGDAFDYNYYILESEGTFSAANAFVCFAKYSNVAKTIGKKSSGGMCAVMPYMLTDGTYFTLSDSTQQNAIRISHDKYYIYEIESGAPVDIQLEYDDFYDLDKILELIHNN